MSRRLIIAGGGTGGHIYCGLAIAEAWKKRGGEVLFVGTSLGMEKKIVPEYGYHLDLIKVRSIKGKSLFGKLWSLVVLFFACIQSIKILRKFKPDVVIGVGGYASGPVLLMSSFLKRPSAIIDQNAYPGFTNRVLSKFVDQIFMTYEISKELFPKKNVKVFGNPILEKRIPQKDKLRKDNFTLVVLGGSQGATAINQCIMEILPYISQNFPDISIIHQTGKSDLRKVGETREIYSIKGEVSDYFDNMETIYENADLIISRSGAGSLTEISLWGIPAILIPYPHAADDHQHKNALEYTKLGAAILIPEKELNSDKLCQLISDLIRDDKKLFEMSRHMKKLGRPKAANEVCNELEKMIN